MGAPVLSVWQAVSAGEQQEREQGRKSGRSHRKSTQSSAPRAANRRSSFRARRKMQGGARCWSSLQPSRMPHWSTGWSLSPPNVGVTGARRNFATSLTENSPALASN
jgi:hypothetical protein